jgi:secreted PhoX family phosphatase
MEVARLANGNEVMYFTATSENAVYTVEMLPDNKAMVRVLVSGATPKNVGFAPTTGGLNSPDNLAQDALGNNYVIEDAPNSSSTGGDIWFVRDADNDGSAESLDHFMSIRVEGSEATGMIFNPLRPTQFVVNVQHPNSTNLAKYPNGFGDAMWQFDVAGTERTFVRKLRQAGLQQAFGNLGGTLRCKKAMIEQMRADDVRRDPDPEAL